MAGSGSQKRQPSMIDVAREAGVAHVTVSRVLNGHPSVRPETRAKVTEVIERLGYRRNESARILKGGRSRTIGIVLAGPAIYELDRMLLGLETTARAGGYWISITSAQSGGTPEVVAAVHRFTEQLVEGVTLIGARAIILGALAELAPELPIAVVMSGDAPGSSAASVEIDQIAGARLATRHLLELGHRRIDHLSGDLAAFDARARVDGWRAELAAAQVDEGVYLEGDFSAASGYELARQLYGRPEKPTAVFAGNDRMAMGVLAAFADLKVRVPQDVSVVGFDDVGDVEYLTPPLSTVRQDHVLLGRRAMEILLGVVAGETPRHHFIQPELIVRRSTALLVG